MIKKFVDRFDAGKPELEKWFSEKHPKNYKEIVKQVITVITGDDDDYGNDNPDPERLHEIDDGDYKGTLLYMIAAKGYQPGEYWYVKVGYGSCSGCDTLEGIRDYSDGKPNKEQIQEYMTLALHIVQKLKKTDSKD